MNFRVRAATIGRLVLLLALAMLPCVLCFALVPCLLCFALWATCHIPSVLTRPASSGGRSTPLTKSVIRRAFPACCADVTRNLRMRPYLCVRAAYCTACEHTTTVGPSWRTLWWLGKDANTRACVRRTLASLRLVLCRHPSSKPQKRWISR